MRSLLRPQKLLRGFGDLLGQRFHGRLREDCLEGRGHDGPGVEVGKKVCRQAKQGHRALAFSMHGQKLIPVDNFIGLLRS
jgi:hypothetical protein